MVQSAASSQHFYHLTASNKQRRLSLPLRRHTFDSLSATSATPSKMMSARRHCRSYAAQCDMHDAEPKSNQRIDRSAYIIIAPPPRPPSLEWTPPHAHFSLFCLVSLPIQATSRSVQLCNASTSHAHTPPSLPITENFFSNCPQMEDQAAVLSLGSGKKHRLNSLCSFRRLDTVTWHRKSAVLC